MKKITIFLLIFLVNCQKNWTYNYPNDSKKWAEISVDNKFCKIGYNQSPIDIKEDLTTKFLSNDLQINYQNSVIEKVKQKYNFKFVVHDKNFVVRSKRKFWLRYLEFHHPSEHQIDSQPYSLELQLYHKSDDEQWLVISLFIELDNKNLDQNNSDFTSFTEYVDSPKIDGKFDFNNLTKYLKNSFYYEGSFTTPPCHEGVKWYIEQSPIILSKNQINSLIKSSIFIKSNAREPQIFNP
jgi:carbonic anhydrase